MNHYTMSDLYVGMKEEFSVTVTEDMLNSYRDITGDVNPLHNDEGYAKERGYAGRVVYGMLTSSFLSTLAGVYLPGEKSLIREVEVKMKKPVYIGDRLTVTGEVTEINNDFNIFMMKVSITNEAGEKVLRGKMQMGVIE